MTCGFLVYTLLILLGHVLGFPLGNAYLHTIYHSGAPLSSKYQRGGRGVKLF